LKDRIEKKYIISLKKNSIKKVESTQIN